MGICDRAVSEKMQMESSLTLKKAILLAQQSESVKTQQPTIRGELPQETVVEAVKGTKVSLNGKNRLPNTKHPHKSTRCERCGKPGFHSRAQCPAEDSMCYKCSKLGHYKSVCRSKSAAVWPRVQEVTASDESEFSGFYICK